MGWGDSSYTTTEWLKSLCGRFQDKETTTMTGGQVFAKLSILGASPAMTGDGRYLCVSEGGIGNNIERPGSTARRHRSVHERFHGTDLQRTMFRGWCFLSLEIFCNNGVHKTRQLW